MFAVSIFLNFLVLAFAIKGRRNIAWAGLAAATVLVVGSLFEKGWGVEPLGLLGEGVFCSAGLLYCQRTKATPRDWYWWGIAPAVVLLMAYMAFPSARIRVEKELLEVIESQQEALSRFHAAGVGVEVKTLTRWLMALMPTHYFLSGMLRVLLVRKGVQVLLAREGKPLPQSRFSDFAVPDMFLWVFAAGLLFEIVGGKIPRMLGHNVILICLVLYFLQGLSVIHSFFRMRRFPGFYEAFFYVFAFITQLPLLFIVAMGFLDARVDFREKMKKPVTRVEP